MSSLPDLVPKLNPVVAVGINDAPEEAVESLATPTSSISKTLRSLSAHDLSPSLQSHNHNHEPSGPNVSINAVSVNDASQNAPHNYSRFQPGSKSSSVRPNSVTGSSEAAKTRARLSASFRSQNHNQDTNQENHEERQPSKQYDFGFSISGISMSVNVKTLDNNGKNTTSHSAIYVRPLREEDSEEDLHRKPDTASSEEDTIAPLESRRSHIRQTHSSTYNPFAASASSEATPYSTTARDSVGVSGIPDTPLHNSATGHRNSNVLPAQPSPGVRRMSLSYFHRVSLLDHQNINVVANKSKEDRVHSQNSGFLDFNDLEAVHDAFTVTSTNAAQFVAQKVKGSWKQKWESAMQEPAEKHHANYRKHHQQTYRPLSQSGTGESADTWVWNGQLLEEKIMNLSVKMKVGNTGGEGCGEGTDHANHKKGVTSMTLNVTDGMNTFATMTHRVSIHGSEGISGAGGGGSHRRFATRSAGGPPRNHLARLMGEDDDEEMGGTGPRRIVQFADNVPQKKILSEEVIRKREVSLMNFLVDMLTFYF
jgi:hypothetical protein